MNPKLFDIGEIDLKELPDIHSLPDDISKVFFILYISKAKLNIAYITPHEIETVLSDCFGIAMSRQRIMAILQQAKGKVLSRKIKGKIHFSIMKAGEDLIFGSGAACVVMIEPDKAYKGFRELLEILSSLSGELKICDPYIDGKTLDILTSIDRSNNIKLLTVNINNTGLFKRELDAYNKQHGNLEVRICKNKNLHDRYIIDVNRMLLVGHSLNGIGKKQTFIVSIGSDIREQSLLYFDRLWNSSPLFR